MKRTVKCGARSVEYTLISSSARKSVLLQALPEKKVRVYAPAGARLRDIDQLVKDRVSWIDEMHAQLDEETRARPLDESAGVLLEGRRVKLRVRPSGRNRVYLGEDGALYMETTYETDAERIAQLKRFLVERALLRVREALNRHSPGVPAPYGRVAIREQRTRWGSCSSKHNLNFNWKLVLAPPEALEYVVIHELCHLIDFNHSRHFWAAVEARMPDYEVWKKWLKVHGKELIFP